MRRSEVLPGLDTPSGNEKLAAVLRELYRNMNWAQVVVEKEPARAESLAELMAQMSAKLQAWMKNDEKRTVA